MSNKSIQVMQNKFYTYSVIYWQDLINKNIDWQNILINFCLSEWDVSLSLDTGFIQTGFVQDSVEIP